MPVALDAPKIHGKAVLLDVYPRGCEAMAEPIKPTEKPNFATGGAAVYATPPAGIQDSGWSGPPQKPPFEWFNWLHRFTAEWIAWFEAKIDLVLGGQADESVMMAVDGSVEISRTNVAIGNYEPVPTYPLGYQILHTISSPDLDNGRVVVIHPALPLGGGVLEVESNEYFNSAGSIILKGKRNAILSSSEDYLILQKIGGRWFEVGRNIRRQGYDIAQGWTMPPRLARIFGEGKNKYSDNIQPTGVALNGVANQMVFDGSRMWFNDPSGTRVWYILPGRNDLVPGPDLGSAVGGLHFDGVNLWASLFNADVVAKLAVSDAGVTQVGSLSTLDDPGRCDTEFREDGSRFLWVPAKGGNAVQVFNAETGSPVTNIGSSTGPTAVLFDGVNIWVTRGGSDDLQKINPLTYAQTAVISVGVFPVAMDFDGVYLYVANNTGCSISVVDPVANLVVDTLSLGSDEPSAILWDGRFIWAACSGTDKLYRIDPITRVASAHASLLTGQIALGFDGRMLWVVYDGDKVGRVVY